MKRHLAIRKIWLGWGLILGIGLVTANADSTVGTPPKLPVTSLILPQSMIQSPSRSTSTPPTLHPKPTFQYTWGIPGDLFLIGCAAASLIFAHAYRRTLRNKQGTRPF